MTLGVEVGSAVPSSRESEMFTAAAVLSAAAKIIGAGFSYRVSDKSGRKRGERARERGKERGMQRDVGRSELQFAVSSRSVASLKYPTAAATAATITAAGAEHFVCSCKMSFKTCRFVAFVLLAGSICCCFLLTVFFAVVVSIVVSVNWVSSASLSLCCGSVQDNFTTTASPSLNHRG